MVDTPSQVAVTPGSGSNVATWQFTESAVAKQIQRVAVGDSIGSDLGGSITDAAAPQTDATALSWTQIFKQISKSVQALAALISGGALPVSGSFSSSVVQGTYTDRSGTITTGGTSQQIMAVNAGRKRLLVQNPSAATESLWINFTAAATQGEPSIELTPGGAYDSSAGPVTTEAVTITAATTAHAFTAKEM